VAQGQELLFHPRRLDLISLVDLFGEGSAVRGRLVWFEHGFARSQRSHPITPGRPVQLKSQDFDGNGGMLQAFVAQGVNEWTIQLRDDPARCQRVVRSPGYGSLLLATCDRSTVRHVSGRKLEAGDDHLQVELGAMPGPSTLFMPVVPPARFLGVRTSLHSASGDWHGTFFRIHGVFNRGAVPMGSLYKRSPAHRFFFGLLSILSHQDKRAWDGTRSALRAKSLLPGSDPSLRLC
jgi:hypothetical protein